MMNDLAAPRRSDKKLNLSVDVDVTREPRPREYRYDVYLSGPMTGIPEFNYPLFNFVAAAYRDCGYTVFNPAESFDGDTDRDRAEYMRADIEALLQCCRVRVLPGWESSKGALLEIAIANAIGLPVANAMGVSAALIPPVSVEALFDDGPNTDNASPEKPATSDATTPYEVVTGARQSDYDHPYDNLGQTAALWNAQFTRKLRDGAAFTAEDVCLAMILLKTSRESFKHKDDNITDVHGYAHCLTMIHDKRTELAEAKGPERGEFRWVGDDDDKGAA